MWSAEWRISRDRLSSADVVYRSGSINGPTRLGGGEISKPSFAPELPGASNTVAFVPKTRLSHSPSAAALVVMADSGAVDMETADPGRVRRFV
jgi:hypothetical protein